MLREWLFVLRVVDHVVAHTALTGDATTTAEKALVKNELAISALVAKSLAAEDGAAASAGKTEQNKVPGLSPPCTGSVRAKM